MFANILLECRYLHIPDVLGFCVMRFTIPDLYNLNYDAIVSYTVENVGY